MELRTNLKQTINNQASMAAQERQLEEDLALLNSSAAGERLIASLQYKWDDNKARTRPERGAAQRLAATNSATRSGAG